MGDQNNESKLDITEELFICCARVMKQYCEQMESCSVCPMNKYDICEVAAPCSYHV